MTRHPSYKSGFASPKRGNLLYPNLWRGCVGAWSPSLGASGANLFDQSGYGNHGTLTLMDPGTDWVVSDDKTALDFDGSDDSVVMERDLPDLPAWSASCWGRWSTAGGGSYAVLFAGKFGSVSGNGLGFHSNVGQVFLLRNNAVPANRRINITAKKWFHAVATWDGTNTALYVDNVIATSGAADSGFGITNTRLGHGFSTNRYFGQLDDVRVYSRVLSSSEIATLALRRGIAYETYRVPIVRGASGGSQTINLGKATESESGRSVVVSNPNLVAIGRATETEAGRSLVVSNPNTVTLGRVTESESANTITVIAGNTVLLGRATEAELGRSLAIVNPNVIAVGRATETETAKALSVAAPQTVSLGRALETESGRNLTLRIGSGSLSAYYYYTYLAG